MLFYAVILFYIPAVRSYPTGPPLDVCRTMTPSVEDHGFAQGDTTKYTVETTAYPGGYVPGRIYNITIKRSARDGQGDFRFKGFMCQARVADNSNTDALGSFISFDTSKAKSMNCTTTGDTLTHKNGNAVFDFSAQWIAPTDTGLGSIRFLCTVVLSKKIFFVKQMSDSFPEVSAVTTTVAPTSTRDGHTTSVAPTTVTTQTQSTTVPMTQISTTAAPTSTQDGHITSVAPTTVIIQSTILPTTQALTTAVPTNTQDGNATSVAPTTVTTQTQSTTVPTAQISTTAAPTSTQDGHITSVAPTTVIIQSTILPTTQALTTAVPTNTQDGNATSVVPTTVTIQTTKPPTTTAVSVNGLLSRANEISKNFTIEDGTQMLDDLAELTANEKLTPDEMEDATSVLDALVKGQEEAEGNITASEVYVKKFVSMSSSLLDVHYTKIWLSLNSTDAAPSFLQTMERFARVTAFNFARSPDGNKSLNFSSVNLVIRLTPVDQSTVRNISIPLNDSIGSNKNDEGGYFKLPSDVLSDLLHDTDQLSVASVVFKDMEKFMPPSTTMSTQTVGDMRNDSSELPSAVVVSVSVLAINTSKGVSYDSNYRSSSLSNPVEINYVNIGHDRTSTCVFWQFANDSTPGHWSTTGVTTHQLGNNILCRSTHLTSFSVLVAVDKAASSDALSYITYIGCGLSLFFLVVTLICLITFRKYLHTDRNFVNINFVIALALALTFFLAGIDQSSNEDVCKSLTLVMHYLFMAVFGWMLCEGILLYLMLVVVFDTGKTYRFHFSALGWGLPLLIVGISFGIRFDEYGTYDYCFLTHDKGLIYAFVGPMAAILVANLVIFVVVLKRVLSNVIANKGKRVAIKSGLRVMAVILPVLGLTWAIGVFAIDTLSLPLAYLFTIFNSLQGIFVFIFHCLLDGGMRNAVKKMKAKRNRGKSAAELNSSTTRTAGSTYYKRGRTNTEAVMIPLSRGDAHKTDDVDNSITLDIEPVKPTTSPTTNQGPIQEDQDTSGPGSNLEENNGDGSNSEESSGDVEKEKALPLVESILSTLSFMSSEYFK